MAVFTWVPQTAVKKQEPKVGRAGYGDGYEQRVGQSINPLQPQWQLTFCAAIATVDAIDAFLAQRESVESFDWTDPRGNTLRVVCDAWEYTPHQGLRTASLSATFRKVHE